MNRSLYQAILTIGATLLAAACANTEAIAPEKEDMLASAGFASKKADNPARMATLKSLPPHQFVTKNIDGKTSYLYADPTACGCIYVGDQNAYDHYRQNMRARQTATDDQIRAIMSSSPLPGEGL
jgi:hypothetical protein